MPIVFQKKDVFEGDWVKIKTPIACRRIFVLILLFISVTSYLHSVKVADEKDYRTAIPWLVDGKATKEEVIQKCSKIIPLAVMSQGKILVFNVKFNPRDGQIVCSPSSAPRDYQLVLVFDENNDVKRHSILEDH